MSTTTQPISVAEVTKLPPDSWVNGGFTAIVRSIERKTSTKTNKPFWKCKLADTIGSAEMGCTLFFAPKFSEGSQVDFLGQGIKFKNGQYGPEVQVGDKAEIHVTGNRVQHADERPHSDTAAISAGAMVPGPTVGMAINNALEVLRHAYGAGFGAAIKLPTFWADVHVVASDIIRVSHLLEKGRLAAPIRERMNGTTPAPARREAPTERQLSNQTGGPDPEDVPF